MFVIGQKVKIIGRSCGNIQMCSRCIGQVVTIEKINENLRRGFALKFEDGYCYFTQNEISPFSSEDEEFE